MNIMADQKNKLPAYGQHFRCLKKLVKSGVAYKLLEHLFDEYIAAYRLGKSLTLPIHLRTEARNIGSNKNSIKGAIEELCRLQVISVSGKWCKVNMDFILGSVFAFDQLDKTDVELQNQFIEAFNDNDIETLESLGYVPKNIKFLNDLTGSVIFDECPKNGTLENANVPKMGHSDQNVPKMGQTSQKWDTETEKRPKNRTFADQDCNDESQNVPKIGRLVSQFWDVFEECPKIGTSIQAFLIHLAKFYAELLRTNYTEDELLSSIDAISSLNIDFEHKKMIVNAVFDSELTDLPKMALAIISVSSVIFFANVPFLGQRCPNFGTLVSHFWDTDINNINIIKEKKENKKEKRKENLENAKADLENNIDDSTLSSEEKNYWQPSNSYYQSKKKSCLPYFRAETIQEFEKDITKCVDRFDKLFIHYLLQIAHELYDRDEKLDEDGLVVVEASDNLIGVPIPVERIYTDLVEPTLQAVDDTIKKGYVEIDGERINVTASLDLEKADLIIDWNTEELCSGQHYIFSYDKFKNPYAEELPVVKKRRRRGDTESRADDYLYMQKVLLMNELDNRWESLTPLELSVSKFLGRFFQFNDNFEIIGTIVEQDPITNKDIEKAEATKNELDLVRLYDLSAPVTFEDFIGCTLSGKTDKYGWMKIMNRMFSAEKIRYWNSMHGYTSAVDNVDVDRLLDEFAKQSEQSEELSGS